MPMHEIVSSTFSRGKYIDLMPYQYGREVCTPGHAFGPFRRSHYLFHYIISGSGTLVSSDVSGEQTTYHLQAGEGFMIFPGQVNTYYADMDDPWEYIWVEFDGIRVKESLSFAGLSESSPVYRAEKTDVRETMEQEMRYLVDHENDTAFQLIGHTYLFLDSLLRSVETPHAASTSKLQDLYIREAMTYIEQNYQNGITVEDIARQTGLNRSYFGKIFKNATDKSPQQYLIDFRMTKAAQLLKLTALSVGEVGRAVGYPNQLHFSRAFKSAFGLCPREWRRENATV
ncbi:AraC family transcriptional regulator [Collinsella tanakaei]|uniref:AraC family transcriptional regulator n=1 Tax=Collinsella tanakaei TaxID=626935 RepID=UPI00195CB77A|nr:AraC family transcriptional regulator [Collinsella tanakaei]